MVKATQTKWVTTGQDYLLPEMCFRGEYDSHLDKQAQILLNERSKKVWMYEGNFTYPQKSFTLFDHNMGLMDMVVAQPKIKYVLDNLETATPAHLNFVKQVMQGLPIHDHGEVAAGEPMTFLLKC